MNSGLFGIPAKVVNFARTIITNVMASTIPLLIKAAPNQTALLMQILKSDGSSLFAVDPPDTGGNYFGAIILGTTDSNGLRIVNFGPGAVSFIDGTANFGSVGTKAVIGLAFRVNSSPFGTVTIALNSNGIDINSTSTIQFSNSSASTGTKDVGLSRNAAGIIKVTNGSSGQGGIVADTLSDVSNSVQLDYAGGSGKIRLASGAAIAFHTTTLAGGADVGFIRDSAGVVRVTNGTTGDGKLLHKGMQVREGSNQTMGLSVLVGGTVTVNTTQVTANSRIFLTIDSPAGTLGFVYVSARVAGTSFTITSSSAIDTSSVAWLIVEPA